jgi:hypothetical protein
MEDKWDDHQVTEAHYELEVPSGDGLERKVIPMRTAMNEVLRDWYVGDCQAGVTRWNKIFERHGMSDRLRLPDRKFNRGIGMFSSLHFDPNGAPISPEEWDAPPQRVAAQRRRPRVPAQHHGHAGLRAGQVRQLHRPARARHPPAANQLRIRENGDLTWEGIEGSEKTLQKERRHEARTEGVRLRLWHASFVLRFFVSSVRFFSDPSIAFRTRIHGVSENRLQRHRRRRGHRAQRPAGQHLLL